jgi:serine/threonine-protein kinase HipA
MARKSHRRALSIWTNGVRVGTWAMPARGDMELRYDAAWVSSPVGRPLSLSLPFQFGNLSHKGAAVHNFFDNLLPDSDAIRKRVAARFKTGSIEAFDLLEAIGRDCVGAVQLLAEDDTPARYDQVEGTPLSDEEVERHLLNTVSDEKFNAGHIPEDDFRISLAGAQEKDAFLRWKGQWLRPHGATPTTHIFKLPLGFVGGRQADFRTSVDNEWLCLRILRAYGLDTADAGIQTFGEQRVLVVERFDRRKHPDGDWLLRLPQEDFCQALGVSPLIKYENQGGPGLVQLFDILRQSVRPQDQAALLSSQILFWLLRAPDGHAKNFSIQLLPGGRFQLAKFYDVMSAYPVLGEGPNRWSEYELKLAMALHGKRKHYSVRSIQRRHFNSTARMVGYGDSAEPLIQHILERTPAVIAEVRSALPADFNQPVADAILNGLQAAAQRLAEMPVN